MVKRCSTLDDVIEVETRGVEWLQEGEELLPQAGAQVVRVLVFTRSVTKLRL